MTIRELLEIKELTRDEAITELYDLCNEIGLYDMIADFVHTDNIDNIVRDRLNNGDWQGVACLLDEVNYLNDEWYYMDGYANLRDVRKSDIDNVIDDIIRFHSDLLEEEEEII